MIKGVLFFKLKLQTADLAGLVNVGLVLWYAPVYWEVCQGQKSTSKSKPSLSLLKSDRRNIFLGSKGLL